MEIKNLSIKKGLCLTFIGLAICSLTSCHKDNSVTSKSSPSAIGFQTSHSKRFLSIAQLDTAVLLGKPTDMINLEVVLLVPPNVLSNVSATIVPDTGALTVFNANQQQNAFISPQGWTGRNYIPFQQLPASDYTLENGGKVSISPGQKSVTVRVSFAGDKIDFYNKNAYRNALSLKLVGANGVTLVDSLSKALIIMTAQSAYAGNYQTTGTQVWNGVSNNFTSTQQLTSVTPNTVFKESFGHYSGLSYLTVNPDNSVTINFLSGIPGPFFVNGLGNNVVFGEATQGTYSQNGINKYDPATKTFTLNYQMNFLGTTTANITETLTLR